MRLNSNRRQRHSMVEPARREHRATSRERARSMHRDRRLRRTLNGDRLRQSGTTFAGETTCREWILNSEGLGLQGDELRLGNSGRGGVARVWLGLLGGEGVEAEGGGGHEGNGEGEKGGDVHGGEC
jgi:hypothetical protein